MNAHSSNTAALVKSGYHPNDICRANNNDGMMHNDTAPTQTSAHDDSNTGTLVSRQRNKRKAIAANSSAKLSNAGTNAGMVAHEGSKAWGSNNASPLALQGTPKNRGLDTAAAGGGDCEGAKANTETMDCLAI